MKCSFCENKANSDSFIWCPVCNLIYAHRCTKCIQMMEHDIRKNPLWEVLEKLTQEHNNDNHTSVELI